MVEHFPESWIKAWEAVWSPDNVVFQMSDLSIPVLSDSGLASIFMAVSRTNEKALLTWITIELAQECR